MRGCGHRLPTRSVAETNGRACEQRGDDVVGRLNDELRGLADEYLNEARLRREGVSNPDEVKTLLDEYARRARNNAKTIWTIPDVPGVARALAGRGMSGLGGRIEVMPDRIKPVVGGLKMPAQSHMQDPNYHEWMFRYVQDDVDAHILRFRDGSGHLTRLSASIFDALG